MYRISSNKCPGAYFLQGPQDPALKRDQAFIRDQALICNAYFKGNVDLLRFLAAAYLYVLFERFLQWASDHSRDGQ